MLDDRKVEIRKKAENIRSKCKISGYGITDLFKEVDGLGVKLIRYPLGESGDLGFTMKKDSDFIIFTNSSSRLARELFTLAHEIGHYILHMSEAGAFIDNAVTISNRSCDEREQEANYFAVCLLLPKDEVQKFVELELKSDNLDSAMDIARIMSAFNVSFEMTLNTLENYGIITGNERLNLDNEKNQKRVSNLLKSVGGNARLIESTDIIDLPHEYIDYAIFNYNHKALPKETLEKVLSCYKLSLEDVSDSLEELAEEDDDLDTLIGRIDF